jgi:YidC/Oxa1 family membrane protein insertase
VDNRRLFLAAILSMAVLFGWQHLFPPPKPKAPAPPPAVAATTPAPAAGPAAPSGAPAAAAPTVAPAAGLPEIVAPSESTAVLESDALHAEIRNRGAVLVSLSLKGSRDQAGTALELVERRPAGPYPLSLTLPSGAPQPLEEALFVVEQSSPTKATFTYRGPLGEARKSVELLPNGLLGIEVEAKPAGFGMLLGPGLRVRTREELADRLNPRFAVWKDSSSVQTLDPTRTKEAAEIPAGGLAWVGLDDTYFLTALIPREPLGKVRIEPVLLAPVLDDPKSFTAIDFPADGELSEEQKAMPRDFRVALGAAGERLTVLGYFGTKQYDRLAALPYGLEKTVRWGSLGIVARPLLASLQWIHAHVIANYGWSIILLTIALKILLSPLSVAAFRSMRKMQALNPRMQAIREKWRPKLRDKQGRFNAEAQRQMNEEVMGLYRAEGVNPAGGCLPMLVQLPIFIGFYNLLKNAVELWKAPWLGWVHDLSAHDPYYILPIVMGLSQLVQQRMTPPPPDPFQKRLMQLLPVVFTVFSLGFQSGLVLYWLTNNIVSIIQQQVYNKVAGAPGSGAVAVAARGKRRSAE